MPPHYTRLIPNPLGRTSPMSPDLAARVSHEVSALVEEVLDGDDEPTAPWHGPGSCPTHGGSGWQQVAGFAGDEG